MWRLRQVSGATLIMVLTGLLTRALTVITQIVIADQFGASIFTDAYFVTETIPDLFIALVAGGLAMTFIPTFTRHQINQGDDEAWHFAGSFLLVTTLFSVVVAGIAIVAAPILVTLIAPGFQGEVRDVTITLFRIISATMFFLGLDAGLRGLLHAHREFVVPDLARFVYNFMLLFFAWTLSDRLGIYALGWGLVTGSVVLILIQGWSAVKLGLFKRRWRINHPATTKIARQLFPILVAMAWPSTIVLLDRIVASNLTVGSMTALSYASRIILLPVGIFVIPLKTALYPTFSTLVVNQDMDSFAEKVVSGLRLLLFVVIPACVGLVALDIPFIKLLFERGAFDSLATLATSEALTFYAMGVPALAIVFFMEGVYFSLGTLTKLITLNIVSWVCNLTLNVILSRTMGHSGIALATAISSTLMALLMIFELRRAHCPSLSIKRLGQTVFNVSLLSALMGGGILWLTHNLGNMISGPHLVHQVFSLGLFIACGMVIFLATALLFRLDELFMLVKSVRKLM